VVPALHCNVNEAGSSIRVEIAGELDLATASDLVDQVCGVLRADGPTRLELDLTGVTYIDSSGLRALFACREVVPEHGAAMTLTIGDGPVARLLELTSLDEVFEVRRGP